MKIIKIHLGFLISVLLVVGAGLIYLRDGGGGLDPWNTAGNEKFIQQNPKGLPALCKVEPLKTPDPAVKLQPNVCAVEFPGNLQVTPYCVNKATNWGGANITIPQGTSQYLNIPKNCSILVNDEYLYAKTIVCSGPAGSTVKLTVQNSCTPPDAGLPAEVKPSCPPDFKVNPLGGCELQVPKNAPTCPGNTFFIASQNCCMDDRYYIAVNGVNGGIQACPQGYLAFPTEVPGLEEHTYEKTVRCIRESSLTDNTITRSYTVTLGACDEKKRTGSESSPSCVLNPATGGCK